jgi:L-asparaginase II
MTAAKGTSNRPIVVGVWRGSLIESRHAVACAAVDAAGGVVASWGDIEQPIYPRSAVKPLQAIPLVETGAADRFGLGDTELALAAASHNGEPQHVAAVQAWLERIGLGANDLECGGHWPFHEASARTLAAAGESPTSLHNNCSGKHAGMLTTALHLGEPTVGYVAKDHPVQRRVGAALAAMCDYPIGGAVFGIDGCSIPTIAMPLQVIATGMARFGAPDQLPPARAAACRRIAQAMTAKPYLVGGMGRLCTALMASSRGGVLVKVGAEGVYAAAVPGRGIGLALKAQDGATRASEVALIAVLSRLGALDNAARQAVARFAEPAVTTRLGANAGRIAIADLPAV